MHPKTEEQRQRLETSVKSSFLFKALDEVISYLNIFIHLSHASSNKIRDISLAIHSLGYTSIIN